MSANRPRGTGVFSKVSASGVCTQATWTLPPHTSNGRLFPTAEPALLLGK